MADVTQTRGRRLGRWSAGGIGAVLIIVIAYAAWLLWSAAHNLKAAADDASAIKAAALSKDPAQVKGPLDDFAHHAHAAKNATGSPLWSLMTHLPFVGDDAEGVRTASRVADDLADGSLPELASVVGDIDAVLPQQGGVDIKAVQGLVTPVDDSHVALDAARERIDAVDPSSYVGVLKSRFRDLQQKVDEAASAMGVADHAVHVLPEMLGADGQHNYLVVMQNNAEIRATGGLPGAVALVSATNGKITMDREVSGASFGEAPGQILPISAAEHKIFGDHIGRYFLDGNDTPDFERSAALWEARWAQTQPEKIDGVISMDTVTLSYLLEALGPVDVGGVHLTSDNVVDELLSKVYARIPDPAAEDAYFGQVASTIFGRVLNFTGSRQDLLQALGRAADEHRLYLYDNDPDIQRHFSGGEVGGTITQAQGAKNPEVGIYLNDATQSKMSYYLRYDTHVTATSCVNGVQKLSGSLTVTSTAPKDAKTALPPYVMGSALPKSSAGDQLVAIYAFAPGGGTISKFDDNNLDFPQFASELNGRPVIGTWALLEPGKSEDFHWTMTSATGQIGATQVRVTPSLEPGSQSTAVASACS